MSIFNIDKNIKKIIGKDDRQTLDNLGRRKFEFGGGIDFNHKGVERIEVYRGKTDELDLPPDFEIGYHTHPSGLVAPSATDIHSIMTSQNQQAEIIVGPQKSLLIIKTQKFKSWYNANRNQLDMFQQQHIRKYKTKQKIASAWIRFLKNKGLGMKIFKRGVPIKFGGVRTVE